MRFEKDFILRNSRGLHARPASLFVQMALTFESEINVHNLDSEMAADGKSVLSMLMLAAPCGTRIRITATGADAENAISALSTLVDQGFDDDDNE